MKGHLLFAIITKVEEWKIDNPTSSAVKLFQRKNVPLQAQITTEKQGENWMVKYSETCANGAPARSSNHNNALLARNMMPDFNVRAFDETGKDMELSSYSDSQKLLDGALVSELRFNVRPQRRRTEDKNEKTSQQLSQIVVAIPLEWRQVNIPFQFVDLPLPPPRIRDDKAAEAEKSTP